MMAGDHGFDRDAISNVYAPALCGTVADLSDRTQGFMAWNHWHWRPQYAFELFVIAATDAAGLDAEKSIIVTDRGEGEFFRFEAAAIGLDHGECSVLRHARLPWERPRSRQSTFWSLESQTGLFKGSGWFRIQKVRPGVGIRCPK